MLIIQVSDLTLPAKKGAQAQSSRISEFQGKIVSPIRLGKENEKAGEGKPKSLVLLDIKEAEQKESKWLKLEAGAGGLGIGLGILGFAVNKAFYPAWVVSSAVSGVAYLFREGAKKEKEEAMAAAGMEIKQPSTAHNILYGIESVAGGVGIACGIGGFFVPALWPIGVAASVVSGIAFGLRQLSD